MDIDICFGKPIEEITDEICIQLLERCNSINCNDKDKYINSIVKSTFNILYDCTFTFDKIPAYSDGGSQIILNIERANIQRSELTILEISKKYMHSDNELHKILHYNYINYLIRLKEFKHIHAAYDLTTSKYLYRLGYKIDLYMTFIKRLEMNKLFTESDIYNIMETFKSVLFKDKLLLHICKFHNWDINIKINEMCIMRLFWIRYIFLSVHINNIYYTQFTYNILQPYIYKQCDGQYTSEETKTAIIDIYEIAFNKNIDSYINKQIIIAANRGIKYTPHIDDLIKYYLDNNNTEPIYELLYNNMDLVIHMRDDARSCMIICRMIRLLTPLHMKKDARFYLLLKIKLLFMNDVAIRLCTNTLQFYLGIFLYNKNMMESCCCCLEDYTHINNYIVICSTCKCSMHRECASKYIKTMRGLKCPQCRKSGSIADAHGLLLLDINDISHP